MINALVSRAAVIEIKPGVDINESITTSLLSCAMMRSWGQQTAARDRGRVFYQKGNLRLYDFDEIDRIIIAQSKKQADTSKNA
jgi:hypothetical protein